MAAVGTHPLDQPFAIFAAFAPAVAPAPVAHFGCRDSGPCNKMAGRTFDSWNSHGEALAVHRLPPALPADPDPCFGLRQRPAAVAHHLSLLRIDAPVQPHCRRLRDLLGPRPELEGAFGAQRRVLSYCWLPAPLAGKVQPEPPPVIVDLLSYTRGAARFHRVPC